MTSTSNDRDDLRLPTLRDVAAPLFRYWRAAVLVTVIVVVSVTTLVLITPRQYQAEVKFLVKHERVDPIVSADPNASAPLRTDVTEDELNSEVELLKGHDLLQRVAAASGLINRQPGSSAHGVSDQAAAAVVEQLESSLKIAPIRNTTFITVTYRAADPRMAARVLSELSTLYFEKHRELHRPTGAYDFYTAQVQRYRNELTEARARLNHYDSEHQVVSPDLQQQTTLQRLSEFESELQQARAKVAESDQTIADLQAQLAATPDRETTQIRTSRNADLTRDLKARILTLESQRTEMLAKFKPSYPPLRDLDGQLEQARTALTASEQAPLTEQTTDRNPTYQFLREELARVTTERTAASARSSALGRSIATLRDQARTLDAHGAAEDELKRAVKSAQDTLDLYQRKQEEARIAEALDQTRIANVAVAEAPTVPVLPANTGRSWLLLLGGLLGIALGVSTAYGLAFVNPRFERPDEIERVLRVPVLATFAARRSDTALPLVASADGVGVCHEAAALLEHVPGRAPMYSAFAEDAREPVVACAPPIAAAVEQDPELTLLVQRLFSPRDAKARPRVVAFTPIGGGQVAAALCAGAARALAAQVPQPTCVVDGDLRSPAVHTALGVPEARGLSDALLGDAGSAVVDLATRVGETIWFVPAGFGGSAALPYLTGESFRQQLVRLRAAFAHVLVEAPADDRAHAVAVAAASDGAVLVLDAQTTRRESARRAVEQCRNAQVPVLGAVLTNRTYPIPDFLYRLL